MKIKKSWFILIVSVLVVTLLGVTLWVFTQHAHDEFKKSVTVKSDGAVITEIYECKGIVPGQKVENEIEMNFLYSGNFVLKFKTEDLNVSGLEEYLDATIIFDGDNLFEGKLSTLLNSEEIERSFTTEEKEIKSLKIIYSMDVSVGSECEGKSTAFGVVVAIEK